MSTPRTTGTPGSGEATGQQPGQAPDQRAGRRQQKIGRVMSDKMQKTIVVAVEMLKPHPIYKRTQRKTARFKAHDEENSARIGDMVRIEETRPLSKEKRWRLVEILRRAAQTMPVAEVEAALAEGESGTGEPEEEEE
jgi:small subunit ribosomal protein S17